MILKNKVCIITGASRGFGKELAILLGQKGCRLVLAAREENELKLVAEKINKLKGNARFIKTDITNYNDIKQIVSLTLTEFKTIDILINNAGIMIIKPFEQMTRKECEYIIDVNLRALINLTHLVYLHMLKKGKGHIINISSIAGKRPSMNKAPYCASKYGVTGFSEALALECKSKGIKVTNVCPGAMKTHLFDNVDAKYKKKYVFMEPKEVAMVLVSALESNGCLDELIMTQMQ
ncbi:SDR family oxidoreductase [Candidatus Woesearchaeota archaeon]|nr:SDR family oxidoreductase [Candidatus Woesearchaeota archaeon]